MSLWDNALSTSLSSTSQLGHIGDSNTFVSFSSDFVNIQGGSAKLTLKGTQGLVWNDSGNPGQIARFEGGNDENLLVLYSETDKVGIGISCPYSFFVPYMFDEFVLIPRMEAL